MLTGARGSRAVFACAGTATAVVRRMGSGHRRRRARSRSSPVIPVPRNYRIQSAVQLVERIGINAALRRGQHRAALDLPSHAWRRPLVSPAGPAGHHSRWRDLSRLRRDAGC